MSDCQLDWYVSQAGTATTDRQCSACPEGQHTYALNATSCTAETPTTSCAARAPNSCCAGHDDSCTANGSSCYCDAYCLISHDCCPDYVAICGAN
jgi:hypothetical protein